MEFLSDMLLMVLVTVLSYWFWFNLSSKKIPKVHKPAHNENLPPVSVVIACKDGADTIESIIYQILNQDYPLFELIVIDDFSTDHTWDVITGIKEKKFKALRAKVNLPGKKAALHQAITEASQYDLLLFTDADCTIKSRRWISSMVAAMQQSKIYEIVLGYGPMTASYSCVNIFARFETALTAIQYFSYALSGSPYMGVGRNLMYTKKLYNKVAGFEAHQHIASGDDDLFIQSAANSTNTTINIDPDSFVYSNSKKTIRSFLNQKARHISTSSHYGWSHKLLLSLFAIAQITVFFILILGLIVDYWSLTFVIVILAIKWTMQTMLHLRWMKKLHTGIIWILFPMLDILLVIYYMIMAGYSIIRKPIKW